MEIHKYVDINTLLNNYHIKEEIKKNRKYFKMNKNENISPNLWNRAKAVLRERLIGVNVYIKREVLKSLT